METSQVSIFAVQAQMNELKSRMQMTDIVNRRQDPARAHGEHQPADHAGRHARGFPEGGSHQRKVVDMVRKAKQIRAKTAGGHAT